MEPITISIPREHEANEYEFRLSWRSRFVLLLTGLLTIRRTGRPAVDKRFLRRAHKCVSA